MQSCITTCRKACRLRIFGFPEWWWGDLSTDSLFDSIQMRMKLSRLSVPTSSAVPIVDVQ